MLRVVNHVSFSILSNQRLFDFLCYASSVGATGKIHSVKKNRNLGENLLFLLGYLLCGKSTEKSNGSK